MAMSNAGFRRFNESSDRFLRLNEEALAMKQAEIEALVAERRKIDDEILCLKGEAMYEAMEKLKAELSASPYKKGA